MKWLAYLTNRNDGNTTTMVQRREPRIPHSGDASAGDECIGAT